MSIRNLILFTVCLFSIQVSWAMEKTEADIDAIRSRQQYKTDCVVLLERIRNENGDIETLTRELIRYRPKSMRGDKPRFTSKNKNFEPAKAPLPQRIEKKDVASFALLIVSDRSSKMVQALGRFTSSENKNYESKHMEKETALANPNIDFSTFYSPNTKTKKYIVNKALAEHIKKLQRKFLASLIAKQ